MRKALETRHHCRIDRWLRARPAEIGHTLAGAEKHLAALKEICLLPCEELKDLERAIAEYRGRK